eukprot:TRINITY_DN6159_c0_g1_i1.p1 TRINITY_DN6159_c0_g1~~TRINITY_DN6159_c0_g1_i1.p1  ORF type:complete len:616 (-),score=134.76 TRINITY_DN6159_c0_g1_i1:470-2317(-)
MSSTSTSRRGLRSSTETLPNTPLVDSPSTQGQKPAFHLSVKFWWTLLAAVNVVWLSWLCLYGHNFENPFSTLSFFCFFLAEAVTFLTGFFFYVCFWNVRERPIVNITTLQPAFDSSPPKVNVTVCHYFEDLSDTRQTVTAALNMDKTFHKQHLWVLDDSFFDASSPREPVKTDAGDVEVMLSKETDVDILLSISAGDMPRMTREGADLIKMMYKILNSQAQRIILSENANSNQDDATEREKRKNVNLRTQIAADVKFTRNVIRPDCADASLRFDFFYRSEEESDWRAFDVSVVGRVKPSAGKHHYKAGNMNNAIYNERMTGDFVLVLDNDMVPKQQMINYLLPWMYKRNGSSADDKMTDHWERDETVAFVQAPQYVIVGKDTENGVTGVVGLSVQKAKDSYGLCQCNGTNMLIALQAMTHVNGMPYDSFTEDNLFGLMVQDLGYRSVYVPMELSTGKLPDNPAAAVLQQIRWSKGQFQSLLIHTGIQKRFPIKYRSEEDRLRFQSKTDLSKIQQIRQRHSQIQEIFMLHMSAHPVASAAGVLYILGTIVWIWTGSAPVKAADLISSPLVLICLLTSLTCRIMSLKMACGNISLIEVMEGMREHYAGSLSAFTWNY